MSTSKQFAKGKREVPQSNTRASKYYSLDDEFRQKKVIPLCRLFICNSNLLERFENLYDLLNIAHPFNLVLSSFYSLVDSVARGWSFSNAYRRGCYL